MPHFNVGDFVTIRSDLMNNGVYRAEGGKYTAYVGSNMYLRKGDRVRVLEIKHDGYPQAYIGEWYAYKVCGVTTKDNLWTYEMFEEGKDL